MAMKDIPETGTGLSTAAVEEITPQRAPARELRKSVAPGGTAQESRLHR